jgi:hypothetical protein
VLSHYQITPIEAPVVELVDSTVEVNKIFFQILELLFLLDQCAQQ